MVISDAASVPIRTKIEIQDFSGAIQRTVSLLGMHKHAVTPDFSLVLCWTVDVQLTIISTTDLSTAATWAPPNAVVNDVTSKITFSQDSSLAII